MFKLAWIYDGETEQRWVELTFCIRQLDSDGEDAPILDEKKVQSSHLTSSCSLSI